MIVWWRIGWPRIRTFWEPRMSWRDVEGVSKLKLVVHSALVRDGPGIGLVDHQKMLAGRTFDLPTDHPLFRKKALLATRAEYLKCHNGPTTQMAPGPHPVGQLPGQRETHLPIPHDGPPLSAVQVAHAPPTPPLQLIQLPGPCQVVYRFLLPIHPGGARFHDPAMPR